MDSRLIALDLGIAHKSLLETLDDYIDRIETAFGVVRFETEKPPKGSKGVRPERVAYLTEDQSTLLMTFSRNNPRVVDCKVALVQAFSKAKRLLKEFIPVQSQEMERMKLELELIRAKQYLQDTGYAIQLSTSPAMLQWLRGEAPPPKEFVYLDRFIDSRSGKEVASSEGRSLTQLITDVGLNPKSKRDKDRVKSALKRRGFDYDRMENWEKASYLREYPVLSDQVYPQVLRAVQGEVMTGESEQNLFVHQMQQATLNQHDKPLGLQGVEQL